MNPDIVRRLRWVELFLKVKNCSAVCLRCRFLFFNTAGRIVRYARKMLLRLALMAELKTICQGAFRLLPVAT